MEYLTTLMNKANEITEAIYSALSNPSQYAFAGIFNYTSNNGEYLGSGGESWLENACSSCKDGKRHKEKHKIVQVIKRPTATIEIDSQGKKHIHKKRKGSR
jgi:hypothetical protein